MRWKFYEIYTSNETLYDVIMPSMFLSPEPPTFISGRLCHIVHPYLPSRLEVVQNETQAPYVLPRDEPKLHTTSF